MTHCITVFVTKTRKENKMKKQTTPLTAAIFALFLAAQPIQAATEFMEDPTRVDAENIAFLLGSEELHAKVRPMSQDGGIETIANNFDGTYAVGANGCVEVVKVNRGPNPADKNSGLSGITTVPVSIELLGTYCQ